MCSNRHLRNPETDKSSRSPTTGMDHRKRCAHLQTKRGLRDCNSYRPICHTQVIYETWSRILTNILAKITHVVTGAMQYGYKSHLATIDSVIKIKDHRNRATQQEPLLLMALSEPYYTIKRTTPCAALYKKAYQRGRLHTFGVDARTRNSRPNIRGYGKKCAR